MGALGGFFCGQRDGNSGENNINGSNGCAVYAKRTTESATLGARKGLFLQLPVRTASRGQRGPGLVNAYSTG
jgi:hypothetical protein